MQIFKKCRTLFNFNYCNFIVFLSALHRTCYGETDNAWNYAKATQWNKAHPECAGNRQSPVAFWKEDVVFNAPIGQLIFRNYELPIEKENVENTGYTVVINVLNQSHIPAIDGANLTTWYALKQFHFHWGENDNEGSEHKIGDEHFPLEVHFVHSKEALPVTDAVRQPDGLAVVGVKFQLSPTDNLEMEKILRHLSEAKYKGDLANMLESISLNKLIPVTGFQNFFRYQGSLTTPPCAEAVEWIVLKDLSYISSRQMGIFRSIYASSSQQTAQSLMKSTFRPVQALGTRTIYTPSNFLLPSRKNLGSKMSAMCIEFILLVFATLMISLDTIGSLYIVGKDPV